MQAIMGWQRRSMDCRSLAYAQRLNIRTGEEQPVTYTVHGRRMDPRLADCRWVFEQAYLRPVEG